MNGTPVRAGSRHQGARRAAVCAGLLVAGALAVPSAQAAAEATVDLKFPNPATVGESLSVTVTAKNDGTTKLAFTGFTVLLSCASPPGSGPPVPPTSPARCSA